MSMEGFHALTALPDAVPGNLKSDSTFWSFLISVGVLDDSFTGDECMCVCELT